MSRFRALDQSLGKPEAGAKEAFAACHAAVVGLVVIAGQMQKPVQDQHFNFRGDRVALFARLAASRGN